jgi:hypothetical protein
VPIDDPDGWYASTYATWSPTSTLVFVAEIWSLGLVQRDSEDLGINAGFEWTSYAGLRKTFYLW